MCIYPLFVLDTGCTQHNGGDVMCNFVCNEFCSIFHLLVSDLHHTSHYIHHNNNSTLPLRGTLHKKCTKHSCVLFLSQLDVVVISLMRLIFVGFIS